jgi:hypothetical protein
MFDDFTPNQQSSFTWTLIGAGIGVATVFVVSSVAHLPLEGWVGALLTTLSASIFGGVGPRLSHTGEPQPPVEA